MDTNKSMFQGGQVETFFKDDVLYRLEYVICNASNCDMISLWRDDDDYLCGTAHIFHNEEVIDICRQQTPGDFIETNMLYDLYEMPKDVVGYLL